MCINLYINSLSYKIQAHPSSQSLLRVNIRWKRALEGTHAPPLEPMYSRLWLHWLSSLIRTQAASWLSLKVSSVMWRTQINSDFFICPLCLLSEKQSGMSLQKQINRTYRDLHLHWFLDYCLFLMLILHFMSSFWFSVSIYIQFFHSKFYSFPLYHLQDAMCKWCKKAQMQVINSLQENRI